MYVTTSTVGKLLAPEKEAGRNFPCMGNGANKSFVDL
jgi:hypothetical protein